MMLAKLADHRAQVFAPARRRPNRRGKASDVSDIYVVERQRRHRFAPGVGLDRVASLRHAGP
jgi:hypothetical protein